MRSIRWKYVILLAGGLCWVAYARSESGSGKEYKIIITRAERVGQKSHLIASARQLVTAKIADDSDKKPDQFVCELDAVREVLAVDKSGRATQISLTIKKSSGELSRWGGKVELAPPGSVVIISSVMGKDGIRTEDPNKPLSGHSRLLFNLAVGAFGMDATLGIGVAYGSEKPRRVGESWPVNSELLAEITTNALGQKGVVKKEGITGRVTLAGLKTVEGIECMELRVEVSAKTAAPLAAPPLGSVKGGEEHSSMTVYLPLDPSIPVLGGERKKVSITSMKLKSPTGREASMETKADETVSLSNIPIITDKTSGPTSRDNSHTSQ